jgi:hypothetical protein
MAQIELDALETLEIQARRADDERGDVMLIIRTDDGTVRVRIGRTADDADRLAEALARALTQATSMGEDWYNLPDENDGYVSLNRGRYYVTFGGKSPAGQPRNGYPKPDIAIYELAKMMAEAGEFPPAWMEGEHGPSSREINAEVRAFHDAGGDQMRPLEGVRYEPGDEVRSDDGTWEVIRDYGELGVWLGVYGDRSAGERFTTHELVERADLLSKARGWIADCQLIRGEVTDLADSEVKRIVEHLYDGGWAEYAREADLLRKARGWIADNQWADMAEDDIADLPDAEVKRGIETHYEGGWAQFVRDGGGS